MSARKSKFSESVLNQKKKVTTSGSTNNNVRLAGVYRANTASVASTAKASATSVQQKKKLTGKAL